VVENRPFAACPSGTQPGSPAGLGPGRPAWMSLAGRPGGRVCVFYAVWVEGSFPLFGGDDDEGEGVSGCADVDDCVVSGW
jgi:hypothetical protein